MTSPPYIPDDSFPNAKIIFLDIDGVLNDHAYNDEAQSGTLLPGCVANLNTILKETGAKIVLSSAWRYIVHGQDITLKGFEYLLRSHGVAMPEIVGITERDEDNPLYDPDLKNWVRGDQVRRWLAQNGDLVGEYVILDDLIVRFEGVDRRQVLTDRQIGLTALDAEVAISVLNGKGALRKWSAEDEALLGAIFGDGFTKETRPSGWIEDRIWRGHEITWCRMCECDVIHCKDLNCDGTTCNAMGCDRCHDDFTAFNKHVGRDGIFRLEEGTEQ